MTWHARIDLDYRLEAGRTVARFEHEGPLRLLKSLYPEGGAVCHNVLIHPPSGLVEGDRIDIRARVGAGAHALITTPGASRFYRCVDAPATQCVQLRLDAGARLEWLPLEALCYSGCLAENRVQLDLAPGAELIGWDVSALGLPAAGQPFVAGRLQQHLEWPGVWLERGCIDAADTRLLDSPLGLGGQRCLATLFFLAGEPLTRERGEQALERARECLAAELPGLQAGVTRPHPQVIVLRVLAPLVEPALELLRAVWGAWRRELWGLAATPPRIWST